MESSFKANPKTCGIMITDSLLKPTEIKRLRHLAAKITEEIGYQSYTNRESINLRWMNLHVLFRKNKTNSVLKDKDYKLIRKASLAAKVNISSCLNSKNKSINFNFNFVYLHLRSPTVGDFRSIWFATRTIALLCSKPIYSLSIGGSFFRISTCRQSSFSCFGGDLNLVVVHRWHWFWWRKSWIFGWRLSGTKHSVACWT